jgi:hypothetical protein
MGEAQLVLGPGNIKAHWTKPSLTVRSLLASLRVSMSLYDFVGLVCLHNLLNHRLSGVAAWEDS